jgi:hypothetical protein
MIDSDDDASRVAEAKKGIQRKSAMSLRRTPEAIRAERASRSAARSGRSMNAVRGQQPGEDGGGEDAAKSVEVCMNIMTMPPNCPMHTSGR